MKAIAAIATVSAMIATVIHATEIADEHRMLAESFVSPGDKTYVVSLRLGLKTTHFPGALITKKHVLTSAMFIGWVDTAVVGENMGDKVTTGESFPIVKRTKHPIERMDGSSNSTSKVKGAAGIYSDAFAVKEWIQKNV